MWGDDGKECSFYAMLPSLYAIKRIYDGESDMEKIKSEFCALTGECFDDMMLFDLPTGIGDSPRKERTFHKDLLYSDAFLGFLDSVPYKHVREDYEALSLELLKKGEKSAYKYIFESQAALCRVLAVKHDLGKRTREIYKRGNKEEIASLADDYKIAIDALEVFIDKFRRLWFKENKPHGFDVQELRLGGLLLRLRSQRERLLSYAEGEIDVIEELEEEILEYIGHGYQKGTDMLPVINSWGKTVSPNVL